MMKSLGDNLTQEFIQLNNNLGHMPAAISATMMASVGNLKTALVGANCCAQSRAGEQFQQCAQQPFQPLQQQPNLSSRNNHMGQVSFSNSPRSRSECFECKEIGHFARDCPRRTRSNHLNWAQLEPQQKRVPPRLRTRLTPTRLLQTRPRLETDPAVTKTVEAVVIDQDM